jgi:hypothetical protein
MMVLYAINNFLAGDDVVITSSSEDALYVHENLYNERPSKPFRFTGHGAVGNPEWICAEFDAPKQVMLAAIFNHNLTTLGGANDILLLKGCASGCGVCTWATPAWSLSLKDRLISGWNDLYRLINEIHLAYRLEIIDALNPAAVELGEVFLGEYTALSSARLSPGRAESPQLHRFLNVTPYGQHWAESLADSITLNLTVSNLNNPAQVDAVRQMILAIHANNGRFVIIPDHTFPFAYYVFLENDGGFMRQIVRGPECELLEWTFQLRTLTKGINLL